jgi:glycosyltransferase involved in cell wall biosynthesis
MRIMILHSRYLSGDASGENRVVEDEARLLSNGGHEVRMWAPSARGLNGADLLRTGARAVWSRHAAAEVRRVARRFRPDVIHCHNLFPALSPAVLRTSSEAPVVMTLHNYRLLCLPATLLRDGRICESCVGRVPWPGVVHGCYRGSVPQSAGMALSIVTHRTVGSFDRVALFLAVSRFVRDKHVQAGFAPERIRVKPNFAWGIPRREGPGEYFLYLGRLSEEKDVGTLLTAWHRVRWPLLVVGDGPERSRLEAMAPAGVEFRQTVPPSVAAELLRRARAILLPSICYEGEPRVVLEAYAAGVPVVASGIGGLADLVPDGLSGIVASPRSPNAWAEAAERLSDDTESERLGEGAHQLWQERHSPERGLQELEAAYLESVGRR